MSGNHLSSRLTLAFAVLIVFAVVSLGAGFNSGVVLTLMMVGLISSALVVTALFMATRPQPVPVRVTTSVRRMKRR